MLKHDEKNQTISDSEWEVMRIVWTLNDAYANQIIEQLQDKYNWSESTIKTLIRRLVNKGFLKADKDGRRFIYSATVSQTEMMAKASKELLDKMCDMHKGEVLLELLTSSPISQKDLTKIQTVVDEKMKSAPAKVPCNCLVGNKKFC